MTLKEKVFYLNNADSTDSSELSMAIKAGIIELNELVNIVSDTKLLEVVKLMSDNTKINKQSSSNPHRNRDYYIDNVDTTEPKELADAIMAGIVSFQDLQDTMMFSISEQRKVNDILKVRSEIDNVMKNATSLVELEKLLKKSILNQEDESRIRDRISELKLIEEDSLFNSAKTVQEFENFINRYPNSSKVSDARKKIEQLLEFQKHENELVINQLISSIHNANPKFIRDKYGDGMLKEICNRVGIKFEDVVNLRSVSLDNSGEKPSDLSDLPEDNTDVFFWGLPSSGKSCALAAIFNTIRREYVMDDPEMDSIYGRPYRISLSNVFNNDGIGYLPRGTSVMIDDTHYMPFVIRKRNSNKKINISFLEIAGEIFKYFKKLVEYSNAPVPPEIQPTINLLNTILSSRNPKIHFFFIDYQQENDTKNQIGSVVRQEDYLDAAATYFSQNHDIFRYNTLSIHIVITKADLLPNGNKKDEAEKFLMERFGGFVEKIIHLKNRNNISNKTVVFPFSIGDVYFNSICNLNPEDPKRIVDKLLEEVKEPNAFIKIIKNIFNN